MVVHRRRRCFQTGKRLDWLLLRPITANLAWLGSVERMDATGHLRGGMRKRIVVLAGTDGLRLPFDAVVSRHVGSNMVVYGNHQGSRIASLKPRITPLNR